MYIERGFQMMDKYFDEIITKIEAQKKYVCQKGLTADEIIQIEDFYDIVFNIDHKNYLLKCIFIGEGFYDWRNDAKSNVKKIKEMLNWPLEGILFDIEHNNYWPTEIEIQPQILEEKKNIFAEYYLNNIPKLIPIFSHRYMCSEPQKIGAPVYSVYQTDIIYYGDNIVDYFVKEFRLNIKTNYNKWERDDTIYWSQFC